MKKRLRLTPVFFSTHWVFDGEFGNYNDDAKPYPLNSYGEQKAKIEYYLSQQSKYLIIRLPVVYNCNNHFLSDITDPLLDGKVIRAAIDSRFNPTHINNVVETTIKLMDNNANGTYNVSAPMAYTRYHIACMIADSLGLDKKYVQRINIDDIPDMIKRPCNTSLICTKIDNSKFITLEDSIKVWNKYIWEEKKT